MWEKMFMPLDRHYDDGLWATGEAFKDAAQKLSSEHEGKMSFMNAHLPINFLYRHATELFLKSAIVTVHRYFTLPSGDGSHQREPLIKIDGKWRPLHRTHSLKTLLTELDRILTENMDKMKVLTPNDWGCPAELIAWIDVIEAADGRSTYFRYPKSKGPTVDAEKSSFLPADPEKLVAEMRERAESGKKGKVVLGLKDDDENIVKAFAMDENPLAELREALVKAAEMMSGCAIGLNEELVKGYGKKLFEWRAAKQTGEPNAS
jgi:hypothetical protein